MQVTEPKRKERKEECGRRSQSESPSRVVVMIHFICWKFPVSEKSKKKKKKKVRRSGRPRDDRRCEPGQVRQRIDARAAIVRDLVVDADGVEHVQRDGGRRVDVDHLRLAAGGRRRRAVAAPVLQDVGHVSEHAIRTENTGRTSKKL